MDLTSWPLFGLRIRTPRVELRAVTDDDMDELVALILGGVHHPDEMPFLMPWTRAEPPDLQRASLQWHWKGRADWAPADWRLSLGVWEDGTLVGQQDVIATDFAVRRVVSSGSWLGLPHQGKGIGTEMRAAILHFAFAGLGAERAQTDAYADNPRSLGVTAKLGYEPNGVQIRVSDGAPREIHHFVMTRDQWTATRRDDIAIDGLDGARSMFGA